MTNDPLAVGSLAASLQKVKSAALKLNQTSDQAAQIIRALEDFLAKECGAGVYAAVSMPEVDDEYSWSALVYARVDQRFRIAVEEGSCSSDESHLTPWAECSRDLKLTAVKHLPELLEKLVEVLDKETQEMARVVESVNSVMTALSKGVIQ